MPPWVAHLELGAEGPAPVLAFHVLLHLLEHDGEAFVEGAQLLLSFGLVDGDAHLDVLQF